MSLDFSEIFSKYEALVAEVDSVFARVQEAHPECVTCEKGCSECCYAVFDLSLVEAMYLNSKFKENFGDGEARSNIVERANDVDRKGYKVKREAYKMSQNGADSSEILEHMAKQRIRCPLLGTGEECEMYQYRPITCRLYGVPTSIGGKAHTCGKTNFAKGQAYPTVNLERIQDRLGMLSQEIVEQAKSGYRDLSGVFVPVSMALLTEYNKDYLAADGKRPEEKK